MPRYRRYLRYAAALVVIALLSLALADSVDPRRAGNLAGLNSFCTIITIHSKSDAIVQAKGALKQSLLDRATLYDFPLHATCQQSDDVVAVFVTTVSAGFALTLNVLINDGSSAYALPTVWEEFGIATSSVDRLPGLLEQEVKSYFDDLVLDWKKQRQP